jgi:hypothetical protein
LVSSFDNFSSFWWENCPSETFLFSLSLSLSLSLIFFFCRFGKKGTKRRKNQHKKSLRREYVERRRLSLRNTLLQKEGRIDLERFFLVENFQRRGERKFALRRVERKRERERRGILISFRREKKATFSESVLLFFLYGPLFVRALNVRKEGEKVRGSAFTLLN